MTLRNNQTGKRIGITFNRRMTHGKPRPKWIKPDDRICTATSFEDGMKHAWFRREVETLVLKGQTIKDIKAAFDAAGN